MKRLMALLMAVMFGVVLFTAPMFADPGDETNTDGTTSADTTAVWTDTDGTTSADTTAVWTDQNYPPPPPDYVGPWPPPGETASGDGGDEDPWTEPEI